MDGDEKEELTIFLMAHNSSSCFCSRLSARVSQNPHPSIIYAMFLFGCPMGMLPKFQIFYG
jgi:hypothetical protein